MRGEMCVCVVIFVWGVNFARIRAAASTSVSEASTYEETFTSETGTTARANLPLYGGEIRGYLGAQLGHHQVAYMAVATWLQVQVTNYNGPQATAQAHIDVATHIMVAKYGAILALN
eukprot:scaffold1880_cov128-Skeletonema_menzelii.AAC.1